MSWSPDLFIGEFRPWPESIRVTRDKTDETRRYVPEKYSSAMQCLASLKNVKLRELVRDLYETAYFELSIYVREVVFGTHTRARNRG